MTNWKEYRLGELYDFSSGLSKAREFFGKGYDFVSFKDVFYNYFLPEKLSELVESTQKEQMSCSVRLGDVFLTRTSETMNELGQSSVALKDYPHATFNGFTKRLRPKNPDTIIPEFVGYYFRSPKFRATVSSYAIMTTRASLNNEILDRLTITLPPVHIQKEIGSILKSLDDKIELNNKINQELEALAQALFKQWFIDFEFPNANGQPYKSTGGEILESELGEIPKGWSVGVLSDIIEFSNGNAFASKELLNENDGDCYHVFKMGHIKKGGGLNADGTKSYYPKSKSSKLLKFVLRKGDLLMCMTDMKGNVALLGHTALMNEDEKYIVNQRVGLLRPKNDLSINYPYLYILTNSTDFIEDLRSRANSGVQVNLSTGEIKNSKVLLPSKEVNIAFDKQTKSFFDTIFNIIEENKQLQTLRDTLLPKLISGELKVSESLNETVA